MRPLSKPTPAESRLLAAAATIADPGDEVLVRELASILHLQTSRVSILIARLRKRNEWPYDEGTMGQPQQDIEVKILNRILLVLRRLDRSGQRRVLLYALERAFNGDPC